MNIPAETMMKFNTTPLEQKRQMHSYIKTFSPLARESMGESTAHITLGHLEMELRRGLEANIMFRGSLSKALFGLFTAKMLGWGWQPQPEMAVGMWPRIMPYYKRRNTTTTVCSCHCLRYLQATLLVWVWRTNVYICIFKKARVNAKPLNAYL